MQKFLYTLTTSALLAPTLTCAEFENPLRSNITSVSGFVEAILQAATYILFPIGVLFVVYAGFMFIKAQGKPEDLKTAKFNIVWVLIGLALILGAVALSTIIKGTINQLL